jgi:hypothetical protein
MKHCQDLHDVSSYSIDDSVVTQNHFANYFVLQLWDDATREWKARKPIDDIEDSFDHQAAYRTESRAMKVQIASTSSIAWPAQTIEITAPVGPSPRGGELSHQLQLEQGPARPSRGSTGARSRPQKWHLPEASGQLR